MKNEDFVLFIKDWANEPGESKLLYQWLPIKNINKILGITSYLLTQFIEGYLHIHWPKLARNKIDTQAELE